MAAKATSSRRTVGKARKREQECSGSNLTPMSELKATMPPLPAFPIDSLPTPRSVETIERQEGAVEFNSLASRFDKVPPGEPNKVNPELVDTKAAAGVVFIRCFAHGYISLRDGEWRDAEYNLRAQQAIIEHATCEQRRSFAFPWLHADEVWAVHLFTAIVIGWLGTSRATRTRQIQTATFVPGPETRKPDGTIERQMIGGQVNCCEGRQGLAESGRHRGPRLRRRLPEAREDGRW